ncbi:hypothetical protein BG262_03945 [Floricoccus penangensis]|uniref:ABC3 transporter permease C-terminal domain-containing protein n=1 Tax=Floricoccus penangensis TaxID=1859475 RepID=A0A9Q5NZ13_9LACT|nr:FtsX-like permease family protein [Floricoccus penangensis]OFI46174.1 hypothetical protein BG262_03945 [Floricoccus penangensis]
MFYLKLAINNIRKSFSNFAPFILASTVMFVMDLIIASILFSPSLAKMKHGATTTGTLMGMGLFIISAFAVIILVYSYRFLIKQRTKEFGLYEILGLSKSQIARVSIDELLILFLATVLIGTIVGTILAKFLYLILATLIGSDYFGLDFSLIAVGVVTFVFLAIYFLLILISSITIQRNSSLSLLKEESRGEKEPKANFVFALLSLVLIGAGYYMAVTVQNPIEALTKFFIAVILVIIGTYLFYLSFTIWLLKRQKANKKYYYQPKHFITVSSMLYRMKQNAVGLANITVLVAMTFVTLAITVALHTGVKDVTNQAFPDNTTVSTTLYGITRDKAESVIATTSMNPKIDIDYSNANTIATIAPEDSEIKMDSQSSNQMGKNYANVKILNREDLVKIGNDSLANISGNEVIVGSFNGKTTAKTVNWMGQKLVVKDIITNLKNVNNEISGMKSFYIIFPNQATMEKYINDYNSVDKAEDNGSAFNMSISTNVYLKLDEKQIDEFKDQLDAKVSKMVSNKELSESTYVNTMSRKEMQSVMNEFTGSFLFIGFTMGLTFILGAGLIIYYKQVSEGAQDKRNYKILQEVGLSKKEVAQTIKSQVMMVFFMPIALAVIHFSFAYLMIKKLLEIFGVTNGGLILGVSAATILGVAAIYFLIYKLTSRVYYNIVERP